MKPVVLYDPEPCRNEYLTKIYFDSLQRYASDIGWPISKIQSLDEISNHTILLHGDFTTRETVLALKSRGNKIISFDINDSSWPIGSYHENHPFQIDDSWLQIDHIYKMSGLQKKNISKDYSIDSDFNFSLVDKEFLPEPDWLKYRSMIDSGRLSSLPYVPWHHQGVPSVLSYSERTGNVLCRGGNHFGRYMVFLWLLMHGKSDGSTSFATAAYFDKGMNPAYRYCEDCINHKNDQSFDYNSQCVSPARWGGELDLSKPNLWNNRCPKSFLWLTEQFCKKYNAECIPAAIKALSGHYQSAPEFFESLRRTTMYTDLKWIFSIYVPPRFWEAASCATVNFLPARTNDQDYFPHVEEGKHFLTFREDFIDFNPCIDETAFNDITADCSEIYENWIRGTTYRIATKLCEKILNEVTEIANEN